MRYSLKLSDSLKWVVPFFALVTFSVSAAAVPVQLENATATFSQGPFGGCPCPPSEAIDGIFAGTPSLPNGWAINRFPGDFSLSETAVFQTVPDLGPSLLTFTMYFNDPNPGHLLGRFRLSVTTDDRSTYADGLPVGGNVTANWTVLTDLTLDGPAEMTFTNLPDDSVLASGDVPGQGIYEVSAATYLSGITGFRLEALEDPSLPQDGPGFYPPNGNFVLSEIQLDAAPIPEPATLALLGLALAGMGWARRRMYRFVGALANERSRSRAVTCLAALGFALFSALTTAQATPISFAFTGVVQNVAPALSGTFQPGDAFSGSYTFESTTPDTDPSAGLGLYANAISGLTFTIGSYTGGADCSAGSCDIAVTDGGPGDCALTDCYVVTVSHPTGPSVEGVLPTSFGLSLLDGSGLALSSDALPLIPPDLSNFPITFFGVNFDDFAFGVQGQLTSLTLQAAGTVAEPSVLFLVAVAFLGLAVQRRRLAPAAKAALF